MRRVRLTYCTNVHDLASPEAWSESVRFFGGEVGRALGWSPMPLGLWWQAPLAESAAKDPKALLKFMADHALAAFTCNAFPYGNFHEPVVKIKVYRPDWAEADRLAYTKNCATALSTLVPEGGFGTLSTLPLGWRHEWGPAKTERAVAQLLDWVGFAADLEARTGKRMALALEAEPGCILERTPQVLAFWAESVLPAARKASREALLPRHLGMCYDTCHQAVQFESPEEALGALRSAGIPVHKMQLSSGLEFPADAARASRSSRAAFVEPRFLHQTRSKGPGGVTDYDDLPDALERADWSLPWRTHFHLPLQAETLLGSESIRTTRADMLRAFRYALEHDLCRHFEVETYTWSVLPEPERPKTPAALAAALARELDFIRANLPPGIEAAST